MKSRRIKIAGNVARMGEMRNASIKVGKLLHQINDYQLLKKAFAEWSWVEQR
jgi:hypothetical protein